MDEDLNSLHIYVPTPGDPPVVEASPREPGGMRGTVLNLGAALDGLYMGAGIHTHGHVFVDARGTPNEQGIPEGGISPNAYSRVTIQSTGPYLKMFPG